MRLAALVDDLFTRLDPAAALADVATVAAFDRYQASAGIAGAAAAVAERATAAGLRDVAVLTFPADGTRRWWSWSAPVGWTPRRARLSLDGRPVVRYPEQPYTLAAYSAGFPGARTGPVVRWSRVRDGAPAGGAVVVLDTPDPVGAVLRRLTDDAALAVVADPLAGRSGRVPGQVGRLELPPGARLAAFSVDAPCLDDLRRAADTAARACVEVEVETGAALPVVTGVLPGDGDEMLLTAHLCHPRPSANDNASGVAALLAAGRVLATLPGAGCAVRFLWGPEFLGTAAYLHDVAHAGRAPVPVAAVNVDMAGEDVARCGGPLVVERGPDGVPSFLPALAERCAALLPPAARSYSGAVPADAWSWRSAPYAGGSDHAIAASEPTRCPVVSLGHWPDRFNHTSSDTVATVDGAELRRTATVAAVTAGVLHLRSDPELAADVAAATAAWAAGHVVGALPARQPPAPPATGAEYDPYDDTAAHRRLRHRTHVATAAVAALELVGIGTAGRAALTASVESVAVAVAAQLPPDREGVPRTGSPVLVGSWPGPANLRALLADATPEDRAWLDGRLAEDRGGNLARLLALADAVRPGRTREDAAWHAALAAELPIPAAFADRAFDLLIRAGWAAHRDEGVE